MKKITLIMSLLLVLCMVSGCAYLPLLYSMSSAATTDSATAAPAAENTASAEDTVTISKAEYEKYQKFADLYAAYDLVERYYYKEPDEALMTEYAVQGMLASLGDPYTFYYNAEDYKSMWEDDDGSYAGIGIQITTSYVTGQCTVSRIFDGSPAQSTDIHKGDILRKVEELEVNSTTINDAVDIMRGTPGTNVTIVVERDGEELTFTVERAAITVNRVDHMMLTDDVGYIVLYEFAGDCAVKFDAALQDLLDKGAKGIVLDMRDNPGGWVEDAATIGSEFLDKGTLCYFEYRIGMREYTYTTAGKADVQMAVLMNENSASSAEVLAGALQDRGAATIVGTQSYGKGIIQFVMDCGTEGAGIQVTAAQYFTPNGNAVHQIGITPDVVVELPEGDNGMYELGDTVNDVQLNKALEIVQEKLQTAANEDAA